MKYVDALIDAIRREHDCEPEHTASVPVREIFRGQTIWQGAVEVFALRGHPSAARCFAWTHAEGDDPQARCVTVLELPPVDSPQAAVRAALLREVQTERQERAG